MSEFHIISTSAPPPPTVPTSFVTDSGTVVPSSNVVNINGGQTTTNTDAGIRVIANPNGSNNEVVQLTNRLTGQVTTTDATLTTILTYPLPNVGVYTFDFNLASHNITDELGASYSVFVGVRSFGGSAFKLNLEDKIVNEESGNSACNVSVNVSGNSVLLQVTGIAGKTINWNAVGTYVYVS